MIRHPDAAFAFRHPAHFIALGFGAGLARHAPGSVGTLVAFPIFWVLQYGYGRAVTLGVALAFFAIGVWACERTGQDLGVADHGAMVWDEVVAFLLVLAILPEGWGWQAAGFVVFRVFDIAKPSPIRDIERRLHGGLGVMADDLVAAGMTLLVLAVIQRVFFA